MDKKAKKILFDTYWKSGGWRDNYSTPPEDFAYAKEAGLMFDPVGFTQAELRDALAALMTAIPQKLVTDAFLCSLTNERVDWRSALGSYGNAEHLLKNELSDLRRWNEGKNIDLNVLNFERIKWGGVRPGNGDYNWLDINILQKEQIPEPTLAEIETFKSILECIAACEPKDGPGKLRDNLRRVIKGTKDQIGSLVETLSYADILKADPERPERFSWSDWKLAGDWRGADKYNPAAVRKYFGTYGLA